MAIAIPGKERVKWKRSLHPNYSQGCENLAVRYPIEHSRINLINYVSVLMVLFLTGFLVVQSLVPIFSFFLFIHFLYPTVNYVKPLLPIPFDNNRGNNDNHTAMSSKLMTLPNLPEHDKCNTQSILVCHNCTFYRYCSLSCLFVFDKKRYQAAIS